MNTKIYKKVHTLATELLKAAQKDDDQTFTRLYDELRSLCEEHEQSEKNHPVQWETLADFTEDYDEALVLYTKALDLALAIKSDDFLASVNYAMAVIYEELGKNAEALKHTNSALESAPKIEDAALQADIKTLLEKLSAPKAIWKQPDA